MRILFIIPSLGSGGGAERSLTEMLPEFAKAGLDTTTAFFFQSPSDLEEKLREQRLDVRHIAARGYVGRIRGVRRLIRKLMPDVVHTQVFEADLIGRIAAVGSRTTVVSSLINTSYDPVRLRDPNIRPTRLRAARFLDRWTARHLTDRFHAITMAAKDAAMQSFGLAADRITVVTRGRDPRRLGEPSADRKRRARRALDIDDETAVVVSVGRNAFQKGHRHLIPAFEQVARTHPDVLLLVAGREGPETPVLRELIGRSEFADRIRLLGQRDDVPEVLAAADVFAFPSLYEGLGGSVVEALAMGLPVVASDLPAVREVLAEGEVGILVPPEAPFALADAITRVLDDPELARSLGHRGQQRFQERYMLDQVVTEMVGFYRSLDRSVT